MICFAMRSYSKKRERNGAQPKNRKRRSLLTVRPRPGRPSQGLINVSGTVFPCALGRGGITANKREGDGGTPLARLRILSGYFRRRRIAPLTMLPMLLITPSLGWCDVADERECNGSAQARSRVDNH